MKTPCSRALTAKYEKSWLVALTKELPLACYIQIAAVDFSSHKHLLSDQFFHSCNSTQGLQLSSGCLLAGQLSDAVSKRNANQDMQSEEPGNAFTKAVNCVPLFYCPVKSNT